MRKYCSADLLILAKMFKTFYIDHPAMFLLVEKYPTKVISIIEFALKALSPFHKIYI